jgi:uncharacterized membrane protein
MLGAGEWVWYGTGHPLPLSLHGLGVLAGFGLPLLAAWWLRGKAILWNVGFGSWVFLVGLLDRRNKSQNVAIYGLCALAAIGLVIWGLQEQRRERINLGVAGFALTIIVFYFTSVMGKLGRSASLVGFGLLFLLGGWQLERLRRKLVAHMTAGGAS